MEAIAIEQHIDFCYLTSDVAETSTNHHLKEENCKWKYGHKMIDIGLELMREWECVKISE